MLSYNTRYHNTIRMAPLEADLPINRQRVLNAITRKNRLVENKVKKPSFALDDHVRIRVAPNTFSKSYDRTWTYEIFRIKEVLSHLPRVMYKLMNWEGNEEIIGLFYEEELQKRPSEIYKIEQRLDTRRVRGREQVLVLFQGERAPRWINAGQLTHDQ